VGDDSLTPPIILSIWGPCNQPRELEEDFDVALSRRQPWNRRLTCEPIEPITDAFDVAEERDLVLLTFTDDEDAFLNSGHHVLGPLPLNLWQGEEWGFRTTIAVRDLEAAELRWKPSPSGLYAGDAWFTLIDGPDGAIRGSDSGLPLQPGVVSGERCRRPHDWRRGSRDSLGFSVRQAVFGRIVGDR
jgi:hypothetical protein